ncbi:MAG: methyltransferase type 12 [Pseudomonadota bacterium]
MSSTDVLLPPALISRFPPALAAFLAHLPGLALVAFLAGVLPGLAGWAAALLIGLVAAGLAVAWRLPIWWRYINLAFVPLLWLGLQAEFDAGWFLAGFLLLALTSLGAVVTRVPLYLSSPEAAAVLAARIPQGGSLCDLGCGLGGPLARISRLRPDVTLAGVEAAPLNWLVARLRLTGRAQIRLGSLWDTDLSGHDVVYAYLSPAPMKRLWDKARAEMKPGSLFVSNSFPVPGVSFDEELELHDRSKARLLFRRM